MSKDNFTQKYKYLWYRNYYHSVIVQMVTDLILLFKKPIALLISSASLAPVVHCCFSNIWCQYFPKPLF